VKLEGSSRQVAWANRLRAEALAKLDQAIACLASIRIPGRRSLFFPDVSAGCYSFAAGVGRTFLACSAR
jgi:hypothetical protein